MSSTSNGGGTSDQEGRREKEKNPTYKNCKLPINRDAARCYREKRMICRGEYTFLCTIEISNLPAGKKDF